MRRKGEDVAQLVVRYGGDRESAEAGLLKRVAAEIDEAGDVGCVASWCC